MVTGRDMTHTDVMSSRSFNWRMRTKSVGFLRSADRWVSKVSFLLLCIRLVLALRWLFLYEAILVWWRSKYFYSVSHFLAGNFRFPSTKLWETSGRRSECAGVWSLCVGLSEWNLCRDERVTDCYCNQCLPALQLRMPHVARGGLCIQLYGSRSMITPTPSYHAVWWVLTWTECYWLSYPIVYPCSCIHNVHDTCVYTYWVWTSLYTHQGSH